MPGRTRRGLHRIHLLPATSSNASRRGMLTQARDVRATMEYSYRAGRGQPRRIPRRRPRIQRHHPQLQRGARRLRAKPVPARRDFRPGDSMKRSHHIRRTVALVFCAPDCQRGTRHPEIPAGAAPTATSNAIVLPADSPMLNQISPSACGTSRIFRLTRSSRPGRSKPTPTACRRSCCRSAGRDDERAGENRRCRREGSAAVEASEPGRGRGDVGVPVGGGVGDAGARSRSTKAQADFDRQRILFEHDAVAKKDVSVGRERPRPGEGVARTGAGGARAGARAV